MMKEKKRSCFNGETGNQITYFRLTGFVQENYLPFAII